uniref:Peptidase A2 domain-containing protein n=1 Tax=Oryzias latipes TaxID=8090 RepID=A0A3P9KIY5_ORYLA
MFPECPVNLLGRDALWLLNLALVPTPKGNIEVRRKNEMKEGGLFVVKGGGSPYYYYTLDIVNKAPMNTGLALLAEAKKHVIDVRDEMSPDEMHVTLWYKKSPAPDYEYEQRLARATPTKITLTYLYADEQSSVAVAVKMGENMLNFNHMWRPLHVSVLKGHNQQWQDLGDMVRMGESADDWIPTLSPHIQGSPSTGLTRRWSALSEPKTPTDEVFQQIKGISGLNNNWLLMVEQTANATNTDCVVCMGPRPMLRIIPAIIPMSCVIEVMSSTNPNNNCSFWDLVFPLTTAEKEKPTFSKKVAPGNFTCINRIGTGVQLGKLNRSSCQNVVIMQNDFIPLSRGDIWWWCGDDRLFDRLPRGVTGYCALVTLLLPVSVIPITVDGLVDKLSGIDPHRWSPRHKRDVWLTETDPTYIDAIGVPRGVPDEYKLVNQVAAGWESSICWWCTINKNVDRINYIHYNVQKLGNWTQKGFEAVHEQLSATSIMAFQNRIALDMLLAEKGGVCTMFGEQCCSFIPNNTAADGSLTKAIEGLRTLNGKMKDHSGVDTAMWDSWLGVFGKYRSLVASALVSIAVFMAILTLCGCCCIPCLRSLCNRLITTAVTPEETQLHPLLKLDDDDDDVDLDTAGLFVEGAV